MKREQLQHVIRAAAEICEEPDFVIIGSQAIHGSLAEITEPELIGSMEVDLYPLYAPEKSPLLNAIGELSTFHHTNGYYADAVDETTAVLPAGWETRLIVIRGPLTENQHGFQARGWCLELHDLIVAKLVAGRDKDRAFFRAVVARCSLDPVVLRDRLLATALPPPKRRIVMAEIDAVLAP